MCHDAAQSWHKLRTDGFSVGAGAGSSLATTAYAPETQLKCFQPVAAKTEVEEDKSILG